MEEIKYTEALKQEIEHSLGRILHSPNDFTFASERIQDRIHEYISRTTLMRIWGYVNEPCNTRMSTLNVLARFLNFPDFNTFKKFIDNESEIESSAIKSEHINTKDLTIGDRVEFTWNPGRRCLAEYIGDDKYEVKQITNSKLQVGDIFTCQFFILNQPLYIFDIQNSEDVTKAYVAGRKTGLTSLRIVSQDQKTDDTLQ